MRGKLSLNAFENSFFRITPAGAGKTKYVRASLIIWRDHPRRCGENLMRSVANALRKGSPPQVRGKLFRPHYTYPLPRITPAGAGKTDGLYTNAFLHWDHPRRCGENEFLSKRLLVDSGSPPQVRGKQAYCCLHSPPKRITPAGAGKTSPLNIMQYR